MPAQSVPGAPVEPTGCCPPFDPQPWQGRELTWHDKLFLKDRCRSLFHVPLGMGRHMVKDSALIKAAHAEPRVNLMLADDRSPWHTDFYLDVTRPVPGAKMETLSGQFLTRVFEGPYSQVGTWAKEMRTWVTAQGRVLDRLYFAYTTCPACAKAYGKNYVIAFAKLQEPVPC